VKLCGGKRRGFSKLASEVQVEARVARAFGIRKDSALGLACAAAALLRGLARRTAGWAPRAWVKLGLGFVLASAPCSGLRGRRVRGRPRIASTVSCAGRVSVASRSVAPPTRLETRTKESNMYASHWAF
jgi:hypothetical protein